MSVRDADLLVFDGYEELAARLLPGADDGMPKGKVVVHTAKDPGGRSAILVERPSATPAPAPPSGVKRVVARLDPATQKVLSKRALFESVLYAIEKSETFERIVEAIRPVRIEEPPDPGREGSVLVWCANGGAFARIVEECLSLGCDRLRWSPLRAGRAPAAAKGAVLARIDSPPWFLLERWSRGTADVDAPVYVESAPGFHVRWGWRHPLAGRLAPADGELVLADRDGALHRLPDTEWRDLYDAISVAVEGLSSVRWAAADPAPRFTVQLRLVAAPEPVEPELWLLTRDDLPAVERLLGLMPEADLKHLAIAFFASPSPGAGEPVAALREVITGRGRGWVNFGRAGFRALPGLPTLFLPIDRALDPQVRRDRVAEAFGLQQGEFTVVEDAKGKPGIRGVRIPEVSFKPLSAYVDYVVTGDAARLQTLVAATVFDPGPLAALAEAKPDPARAGERDAVRPASAAAPLAADGGALQPDTSVPDADFAPVLILEPEPEEASPSSELQIEKRIAEDPPGAAADWMALGDSRLARRDWEGALECFENARWTDRALESQARARAATALTLQSEAFSFPPDGETPAAHDATSQGNLCLLRMRALHLETSETAASPRYLESIYAGARAASDRLRKKTRWLVWRAVLARTGDDIELERQREQILADLNQAGLAPLDRTDFVRARLAERALDGGNDGDLRRTMEGLTARLSKLDEPRLRWTGTALLARRWAELDDVVRAKKLAQDAVVGSADMTSAATARIHANAAAALLRIGDAGADAPFNRALDITKRVTNGDERGRTLHALVESLATVADPKATLALADASVATLEADDPRRAALTLWRCAPTLRKLEATQRARALALKLAFDPRVQQDAHYLGAAVHGLAIIAGPASLPPNNLAPILEAVRRHQRDLEDVNVKLVEGAVTLAGEDFARELADQMRALPVAELRFAQLSSWAAAIQGLATARAADAGLADLDRSLKLSWALPNDDERRRSVKRLTGVIAAFGRVTTGLEMVQEVVRRAEAPGIGPYFRSEVLSTCVDVAAKLGDRKGAFDVMARVIALVEHTARQAAGDVTFLFDVLGLCVDHAVQIGAAGDSVEVIRRVESIVEEWMVESSARFWTPFYRYKALAKCGRGLARLGHEEAGLAIIKRILAAMPQLTGLDRIDLLREVVHCLSEIGGAQRLTLVDGILDSILAEKSLLANETGGELLSLLLDEVVSPASRVRAEYARFLGADERSIRERVANEQIASR